MRRAEDGGPWVVYVKTVKRSGAPAEGANAICAQAAWDAM